MLTHKFDCDIFSLLNKLKLLEGCHMSDKVDCDIRELFDKISARTRRDYSESLRDLNLYVGQDNLLYRLWSGDGVTQMQLCEHLKCEPPTVSNMVKSLEQNGFIYRKRDEKDARVVRIFLTQQGKELEEPITIKWRLQQDKLLHSISPDERLLLRRLMKQMESNLF